MERLPSVAVIIVTHDSARVLPHCLAAVARQTLPPARICVVDSASPAPGYLAALPPPVELVPLAENIGFARANNAGFLQCGQGVDYVLFLNPDALLAPDAVERAVLHLAADPRVGALTGRLLGYDFTELAPTGRLDSTGIFRKWYGRWFDRGQGEADQGQYARPEDLPAACGAMLFCRGEALARAMLPAGMVFAPDFFLYKEDIELCLRLRGKGWLVRYAPEVVAWHGRGWGQRREMNLALRRLAASSELVLYRRHPSPYLLWALLKYLAVRLLKV